ncbi:unnamed protein product [Caenorhabditis auriculariae]|uniref:Uncharacterized protein n=1 Tax=Caenorhabditis auriculariae TaxID=2777116 RepID=A0A8S1H6N7_9PELO|nr:unnamed protein product [Caenorhabditis auriculariae]
MEQITYSPEKKHGEDPDAFREFEGKSNLKKKIEDYPDVQQDSKAVAEDQKVETCSPPTLYPEEGQALASCNFGQLPVLTLEAGLYIVETGQVFFPEHLCTFINDSWLHGDLLGNVSLSGRHWPHVEWLNQPVFSLTQFSKF